MVIRCVRFLMLIFKDLVILKISHATYEDSGKYRQKLENRHGADYHHCLVSVEGNNNAIQD